MTIIMGGVRDYFLTNSETSSLVLAVVPVERALLRAFQGKASGALASDHIPIVMYLSLPTMPFKRYPRMSRADIMGHDLPWVYELRATSAVADEKWSKYKTFLQKHYIPIGWGEKPDIDFTHDYLSTVMHAAMTVAGWERRRTPEKVKVNNRIKEQETHGMKRLRRELEKAGAVITRNMVQSAARSGTPDLYDERDHSRAGVWKAYKCACPETQGPTKFVKIREGREKGRVVSGPARMPKAVV